MYHSAAVPLLGMSSLRLVQTVHNRPRKDHADGPYRHTVWLVVSSCSSRATIFSSSIQSGTGSAPGPSSDRSEPWRPYASYYRFIYGGIGMGVAAVAIINILAYANVRTAWLPRVRHKTQAQTLTRITAALLRLVPCLPLPLAFYRRHFCRPSHPYDSPAWSKQGQDRLGMPERWPEMGRGPCGGQCYNHCQLPRRALCSRILNPQPGFHRIVGHRHRFPGTCLHHPVSDRLTHVR